MRHASRVCSSGLSISELLLRATEIARNWNNATRDCISSEERGRERDRRGGRDGEFVLQCRGGGETAKSCYSQIPKANNSPANKSQAAKDAHYAEVCKLKWRAPFLYPIEKLYSQQTIFILAPTSLLTLQTQRRGAHARF